MKNQTHRTVSHELKSTANIAFAASSILCMEFKQQMPS